MYRQHFASTVKKHPHINMVGQYEFWRSPYYKPYISKYGYHFNDYTFKLATSNLLCKNNQIKF